MKYKVIIDNTCELTDRIKACDFVEIIGTSQEKSQKEANSKYLKVILNNMQHIRKECPNPEAFKKAFKCDADAVFVITMSRKLSGAFASAVIGRSLYFEEYGEDKRIKVFNSNAVSCGEAAVAEKIIECIEKELSYEDICSAVSSVKKELGAGFLTETVEYIKKLSMGNMAANVFACQADIKA